MIIYSHIIFIYILNTLYNGGLYMEELIELLQDIRDDVDFENCTDLIDGKILSSFDIIQIISVLDDEYDLSIPASEIIPANFNSAKALYDMIQRLK